MPQSHALTPIFPSPNHHGKPNVPETWFSHVFSLLPGPQVTFYHYPRSLVACIPLLQFRGGGGQYDAHSIIFFCHTFYATQTMEPIVYYFPLLHNEYDNLFRCNFIMLRCAILAEFT